jgi:hypothetical protein
MDLHAYYQKLRKIEKEIQDEFPVVVSRETSDGGKRGLLTQVPRALAARLIADGNSELASAHEAAQFLAKAAEDWQAALDEEESLAKKPAKSGPRVTKRA